MTALDVVIPVRAGDKNPELRWALRCLEANFPHNRVWIVGYQPAWVTNVEFIPGNGHYRHRNVYENVLAACEHPDTPAQFVISNDDIFVTEPVPGPVVGFRGPLATQVERLAPRPRHWWRRSLELTLEVLRAEGVADPISYELHMPLPVHKARMAEVLRRFAGVGGDNPPQWRTLYGNLATVGGARWDDCKARWCDTAVNFPYHSTDDQTWVRYAAYFRKRYPRPCRYEKGGL